MPENESLPHASSNVNPLGNHVLPLRATSDHSAFIPPPSQKADEVLHTWRLTRSGYIGFGADWSARGMLRSIIWP